MVFGADGTVRTSAGWRFHEARPEGAARPEPASTAAPLPRAAVLAAIAETAERHASHPALARLGMDARQWGHLFQAMIEAESAYRVDARSPKDAYGLGQLMPQTARELGVDRTDPAENLEGAARYLVAQMDRFGSAELGLAAYNAGPHRVVEHGGVPPFRETRAYVKRISAIYERLSREAEAPALLAFQADEPALSAEVTRRAGRPLELTEAGAGPAPP